MRTLLQLSTLGFLVLALTGCMSSNVKTFQADPMQTHHIEQNINGTVYVGTFNMAEDDNNSIFCRMAGNVYLPDKMTFSQYIKNAFEKNLVIAKKYEDEAMEATHQISADIKIVDFSSMAGAWEIAAYIKVDDEEPVYIETETEYGSSFDAYTACKNTAESFEMAVQHFVRATFEHPKIAEALAE